MRPQWFTILLVLLDRWPVGSVGSLGSLGSGSHARRAGLRLPCIRVRPSDGDGKIELR